MKVANDSRITTLALRRAFVSLLFSALFVVPATKGFVAPRGVISHGQLAASGRDSMLKDKRANAPLFACTWTGSVNTNWSTAGNWSSCNSIVPQAGDTVSIGGAANQPTLAATAPASGNLSSVTINSSGTLTVATGGTLNTSVNLSLNGGTLS